MVGEVLVELLLHLRLVVEQVHLTGAAVHEQHDDPLGLWRKTWHSRHARSRLAHVDLGFLRCTQRVGGGKDGTHAASSEKRMESGGADSHSGSSEELSSG